MIISGCRGSCRSIDAIKAVREHEGLSLKAAKSLIEDVMAGTPRQVSNDFLLREKLEDASFFVE